MSTRLSRRTKLGAGVPPVVYTPPVAGPLLWLDAGTEGYTNGAAVPTATDRSGNARNATEATNRPVFVTGALNGLPVYRFDGVDDKLQTATFAMTQPVNVFIVGKASVDGVNQYFCDARAAANTLGMSKSGGNALSLWGGGGFNGPTTDTAFHIMHGLYNGAASVARKDGGAGTTGDAGTASPSGFTLGAYAGLLAFLIGDVAEALLYGSLTTSQMNTVGDYLAAKYGLTWTAVP